MTKGYFEDKDVRTGKAPRHQASSKKSAPKGLQPVNGKVFTYETVETAKKQLESGLKFPFIRTQHSMLGGKERISILVNISKDPQSQWANKIYQNSRYAQIHISNDGGTEQFSGWQLKMRKFKGKSIAHIIEKINAIKEK